MKFNIPKEWIERNAHKEDGLEIGAGVPSHPGAEAVSRCAPLTGYARWSHELKALAKKNGVEWYLDSDTDWKRDYYDEDYKPAEVLSELYMEMCASASARPAVRSSSGLGR